MTAETHHIRLAQPGDVEALPEIERMAGLMFKTYPEDLGIPEELHEQPNTLETFADAQLAGRLWVATEPERHTALELSEIESGLRTDNRVTMVYQTAG